MCCEVSHADWITEQPQIRIALQFRTKCLWILQNIPSFRIKMKCFISGHCLILLTKNTNNSSLESNGLPKSHRHCIYRVRNMQRWIVFSLFSKLPCVVVFAYFFYSFLFLSFFLNKQFGVLIWSPFPWQLFLRSKRQLSTSCAILCSSLLPGAVLWLKL